MTTIIIIIAIINLYFYNKAYESTDEYNSMLQEYIQINNLSIQLIEGRDCISRYISTKDNSELNAYLAYKQQMESLSNSVFKSSRTLDTYLLSKAIVNSIDSFSREMQVIIDNRLSQENYYTQYLRAKNISLYTGDYIKQLLNIKLSEGEWYNRQLTNRVAAIRMFNLASLIGVMLSSLIFVLMLSRSITVPIKHLTQFAMKVSHGDFDIKRLEIDSSDDINILAYAFNKMAAGIRNMFELERKFHEEELKGLRISQQLNEARFLALQSQINPHFLFNTLNAIMRISMFENANKTSGLIQSLSSIFRYNLRSVNKEVLLNEELDIIREYVSIQKLRFGDRISFSIVLRTDISNILIPRFIIQPLVENSIVHGLEPKETGGAVRIKIYKSMSETIIKIIDNGIGIPKQHLQRILSGPEDSEASKGQTTGIGIYNVKDRLALYYKNENCFDMKSREGKGTVITIRIRGVAYV